MLTWNVTFHTRPGRREAFYRAVCDLGVPALSRSEQGNRGYDYYFSAEDENALLLVETWESPEDQAAHARTEVFAKLQELKARECENVTVAKFTF